MRLFLFWWFWGGLGRCFRGRGRLRRALAGGLGSLSAARGFFVAKTLTGDQVPRQSARKALWLSSGQVAMKEGAFVATPTWISVNTNTLWGLDLRAAHAKACKTCAPEALGRLWRPCASGVAAS